MTLDGSPYKTLAIHTDTSRDDYERDTQRVLCNGAVFKEGVQAFLEKRKPNFRDIEEV